MTLSEFINRENILVEKTVFVGKTKKGDWDCFEWMVTLVNLQGSTTLATPEFFKLPRLPLPFYMGLSHVGFKSFNGVGRSKWRQATDKEIKKFLHGETCFEPKPIPPDVNTVLSNLHSTCTDIDNNTIFEDWCSNYGYNIDSRKVFKLYQDCTDEYMNCRKFFGNKFTQFLECENDI